MKTLFKVVAGLVVVIVVVVIAAIVILPRVLDPNAHKDTVIAEVKAKTGRDLAIDGDIELTYFPWLGVRIGKVSLSDARGFSDGPFARTEQVNIRVKLMPLLSQRVEMDTVVVHGLELHLAKNKAGKTNWADLAAGESGATTSSSSTGDGVSIAALTIGGVDIRDAALSWRDDTSGQRFALKDLAIQTGAITSGAPVPLEVSFALEGGPPAMAGSFKATATVDAAADGSAVTLRGLEIESGLTGDTLPGGKLDATLAAEIMIDVAKQQIAITDLRATALGLDVTGTLDASSGKGAPSFRGRIAIAEFSPRALLEALGQVPPETADAKVLTKASVETEISGGPNTLELSPLKVRFDDSQLEGTVKLADIAKQALRFDLVLDQIDADRYLPPASEKPAPATPGTASAALPNDQLRALDVEGKLRAGKVKITKLTITDASATVSAKNGLIRLSPIAAKLYEGTYAGNIALDARKDVPRITLDEKLIGIEAGPLLTDLQGEDRLTGKGNVELALSAAGTAVDTIKKTLTGDVGFSFANGAVKGVNIGQMVREARAKIQGKPAPAGDAPNQTDFAELKGTVKLNNGHATNQDLSAKSPLLRIEGAGEADLPTDKVDYTVKVNVVATSKGQGGKELEDLAKLTIPVRVTGTLNDPSYGIDVAALGAAFAQSKAGAVVEQQKAKALDKVKEKAGAAGGDTVKKLLGGESGGGLKGLLNN